jgi:hypothetical protein
MADNEFEMRALAKIGDYKRLADCRFLCAFAPLRETKNLRFWKIDPPYLELVRFSHTIFALPFALLSA